MGAILVLLAAGLVPAGAFPSPGGTPHAHVGQAPSPMMMMPTVNLAKYGPFHDEEFNVNYSQGQVLIASAGWSTQLREPEDRRFQSGMYDPSKGANLAYRYFLAKGARIRSLLHVDNTTEDARHAQDKIFKFLQDASSNVKFLYLTGPWSREGAFTLSSGRRLTPLMFVERLRRGKATGLVTLIVDVDFAGTWYDAIWKERQTLEAAPKRARANLYINLWLRYGVRWSERLFDRFESQTPHGEDGWATPGWGTKMWLGRPETPELLPSLGPWLACGCIMYNPVEDRWTEYRYKAD